MASPLLDKATLDALTNKTTVKSTILASSVARLYVSTDRQWRYTGIYGIIAYIMDRESRVQYIRIYDLSTMSIRFQTEIAVDAGYYMDTEYFHTLEMENDAIVGFLFSIAREKSLPEDKNKTLTSEAKRFGSKVMQLSLKESDLKEVKESKGATPQFDAANGKRRASTIMGAMRTVHKAASKFLGGAQAPASVGAPTDFRHVGHIGLNPDGTMSVNNVPDEWKVFLKAAGITKKDFMNPEKNKVIVSTLGAIIPATAANTSGNSSSGATPLSSKDQKTPKQMQVKYAYERAGEKEVSVTPGDLVTLVKSYPDGWAKVKKNNGEVGMVPVEYLRESSSDLSHSPLQQPSQAIPKRDSPKNSPAVNSAPKKVAPPPVPASPAKSTTAPPPPRSVPPRPVSSRPPPIPAAAKGPAPAPEEDAPAEEYPEEQAQDEAPSAKPDVPRPNPMLLAGIQSFNKSELAKAEDDEDRPARPPLNPLLASIQGFNKDGLSRTESGSSLPSKSSTPNPLEAIKSGNFQLKKVEKVEKPVEAKAPVPAEVEGIAGLLKAKLANIRLGVQDDDDDDDAGSDWD